MKHDFFFYDPWFHSSQSLSKVFQNQQLQHPRVSLKHLYILWAGYQWLKLSYFKITLQSDVLNTTMLWRIHVWEVMSVDLTQIASLSIKTYLLLLICRQNLKTTSLVSVLYADNLNKLSSEGYYLWLVWCVVDVISVSCAVCHCKTIKLPIFFIASQVINALHCLT